MPRPQPQPSHPVQQRLFQYLYDNELTYKSGAKLFAFGTAQALHLWLFKEHKREPDRAAGITERLDELESIDELV